MGCRGGENDVVDVQQEVGELIPMAKHEQGHVGLRGDEAETVSVVGEALIPRSRSLLEAVQRLVKAADVLRTCRVGEARRLLAVDLLVKIAMKKGVLDVQLMNRPCTRGGDAEDDANGRGLDDGTSSQGMLWDNINIVSESKCKVNWLKCAESALKSVLGGLDNTYFVGNAPMAHMVAEQTGDSSVLSFKRFFFKSQVIGTTKLDVRKCEDHVWVTKDELLEYFPEHKDLFDKMIIHIR